MAATYTAFMATRYYSSVFNTALFDGPFRIYFSQSYESSALKLYHLLQTQHEDLCLSLKRWSSQTKDHVFLLMYPEQKDLDLVFSQTLAPEHLFKSVKIEKWSEGIAVGCIQPMNEIDFINQLEQVKNLIELFLQQDQQIEESNKPQNEIVIQ
jgi:hypothetical protein